MGKSVYNPLRTTHPRPLLELRPGSCVCVCVRLFNEEKKPFRRDEYMGNLNFSLCTLGEHQSSSSVPLEPQMHDSR